MQKQLYLFLTFLLGSSIAATAQQHTSKDIPDAHSASISEVKKPSAFYGKKTPFGGKLHKTAINERLYAFADYIYIPNEQKLDSFVFTYSGDHSSAFDYYNLMYDYYNQNEYPIGNTLIPVTGYMHFDTMRRYGPGSSTPSDILMRTYNTLFDKVATLTDSVNKYISYYEYDAVGKLKMITKLNAGGGGFDSVSKEYFFYNGAGYDEKDSTEVWNGAAWETSTVLTAVNNAAGHPLHVTIAYPGVSGMEIGQQITNNYNALNQLVTSVRQIKSNVSGMLINASKDTFAYKTGMITLHNQYTWNDTAATWNISMSEQRQLNASALPDAIFRKHYSATAVDSSIERIAYNSKDNPLYQRNYSGNGATLQSERRYYYSLSLNAQSAVKKELKINVYPNPATDVLRVNGISNGTFTVSNMQGQLLINGQLHQHNSIPVHSLPAGIYQLTVYDASGAQQTARFVKQ